MKKLTFFCLACRRDTSIEHPPVKCDNCGSEDGLIFRWQGRSWRRPEAFNRVDSAPVPAPVS